MGEVLTFESAGVRELRVRMADSLEVRGSVVDEVAGLAVDVSLWLTTARQVARQLGRPIRTGMHPAGVAVWAALTDWPATPDEPIRADKALRRAVKAL